MTDLGIVTAYAYYVAGGGTKTEAEFTELMASYGTVAESAAASAILADEKANAASASATQASESASSASASATQASQSETNATAAEASVRANAQAATDAATEAQRIAESIESNITIAQNAATSASTSASNASASATQAESSASNASASAQSASESATNAAESEGNARTSETNATRYAEEASASATTASTKASEASASATSASESASTASTKAQEASQSANNASVSANTASTKATEATTAATNAETYKNQASTSADNASASATRAEEAAASITVDATLTQSGKAADAKVTGDKISELKNDLTDEVEYTDLALSGTGLLDLSKFVQGSLNVSNNKLVLAPAFTWRACTPERVVTTKRTVITPETGYRMWIGYVNAEGTLTGNTGWKTEAVTLSANIGYQIILAKATETTGEVLAVWDLLQHFSVNSDLSSLYDKVSFLEDGVSANNIKLEQQSVDSNIIGVISPSLTWEQGNLKTDGTDEDSTYIDSRLRTDYIDISDYNYLRYKIASGFRIYYYLFDSSETVIPGSASGWKTNIEETIDISDVAYIRILFCKLTDGITPYATVSDIETNLQIAISHFTGSDVSELVADKNKIVKNTVAHSLLNPANSKRYLFAKGAMWKALRNTAEAYELAGQDARCWGINGDVQYTSDDVLVMWHDQTISYNGNTVAVRSLTYAQVSSITLTQDGKSYTIPTLDDFISICRKYGKVCNIELKGPSDAWSWTGNGKSSLIDTIISKIYDMGMQDSCFIDAVQSDFIYIQDNYPQIPHCRLWDANTTEANIRMFINDPQAIPSGYAENWVSNDTMKIAHAAGQKTMVYSTRPQTIEMIRAMEDTDADIVAIFIDPDGVEQPERTEIISFSRTGYASQGANVGDGIKVASYNICNFNNDTTTYISDEKLVNLRKVVDDIDADILCVQEDREYINGGNTQSSNEYLYYPKYPYRYGLGGVTIHSKAEFNSNNVISLSSGRAFRCGVLTINDKKILIVSAHPGLTTEIRAQDYPELFQWINGDIALNRYGSTTSEYAPTHTHTVVCGDMNSSSSTDKTNLLGQCETYNMIPASGGRLGWLNTAPKYAGENRSVDNVIVSNNIIINKVTVYGDKYNDLYSDHVPVVCDLTLL